MATRRLDVVLAGDSKRMRRAMAAADGALGRTMKRLAVAGAAFTAFAAVVGVKAVQAMARFGKQMAEVWTLLPTVGGDAIRALGKDVLTLSDKLGVATTELTQGLYQALSAGVPKGNVIDYLSVAAKTAIGGVTDTKTAVDLLTTTTNNYASAGVDARVASDVWFTAVRLGKTTIGELGATVSTLLPVAKAYGVDFRDAAAAVTLLTTRGVKTSEAMTQMAALMKSVLAPTIRQTSRWTAYGLSVDDVRAAIEDKGFGAGIASLVHHLQGLGATDADIRALLGSSEALNSAMILASEDGGAKLVEITDAMNDAAGATDAAFERMAATVEHRWRRAQIHFQNHMIRLGYKLLPAVTWALGQLERGMANVSGLVASYVTPNLGRISRLVQDQMIPAFGTASSFILDKAVPALKEFGLEVWAGIQPHVEDLRSFIMDDLVPGVSVPLVVDRSRDPSHAWPSRRLDQ